ncbi:MAG: molybdopterin-guanine dinucleotide biosynthesis protein A [Alphaproteobacteria bacterium]|nr:molybdopterin-guanine dinucleotide biosynthesis protein A [Alphaproteobacteria bacterium]
MAKFVLLAALLWLIVPSIGNAADRHANYYYPPPQTSETYKARAQTLPETGRRSRIAFVTGLTNRMLQNPYPPEFAIFAKGTDAEKLIIVSVKADTYDTIYRMRGLLATLTAVARVTPLFKQGAVEDFFTFFDLCKMLGFERITVSDGRDFAHRINIE